MEIQLRPEIEELIKQDIQGGAYRTIAEFVEHAVALLHERETWLAQNHTEIRTQIEEGYAAALRGELIDADEVRARLDTFKRTRTGEQHQG